MKSAAAPALELGVAERQRLIADLFHALSQPITALRCSLESALHGSRATAPSAENLQTALEHAERIARLAGGIRQLLEADDPGDERVAFPLEISLREAVVEMQPIAEAARVRMQLRCASPCRVVAEPQRMRQGWFYLLEFALTSAAESSILDVTLIQEEETAVVRLSLDPRPAQESLREAGNEAERKSQQLSRRLGLAIAGRIFEAAGGRLQIQEEDQHVGLRLRLPCAA